MLTLQCCKSRFRPRPGEVVEVRSLDEILGTLDGDGTLDGMPFMPEMAKHAGGRFRVYRHAGKTCVERVGIRRLADTVFLDGLRCDGSAHDRCQRACLMFWKTAWLKPALGEEPTGRADPAPVRHAVATLPTRNNGRYFCQSTELLRATAALSKWDVRPFVEDLWFGEMTFRQAAGMLCTLASNKARRWLGWPPRCEPSGRQSKTSPGDLDLRAGEWVEVKGREEIEATLNAAGQNRGLSFEPEMLEHCGRRCQVAFPIGNIILEATGQMAQLTHTVTLDGVVCRGKCAKNCPRANYFYWREAWLRRAHPPGGTAGP